MKEMRKNLPPQWSKQKRQITNTSDGNYNQKLRTNHNNDQSNDNVCALNRPSQTPDFGFQFLNLSLQSELVIIHKSSMTPNDPKLSHGHWRLALACNLDSQIS